MSASGPRRTSSMTAATSGFFEVEQRKSRPASVQGRFDWAKCDVDTSVDACLISCTAVKSTPVIAQLEKTSGQPMMLTSDQSTV